MRGARKEWRQEKWLKRLEAVMLVCDKDVSLTITGNGDVLEPEDGIIAIGSGGGYALAGACGERGGRRAVWRGGCFWCL